MLQTKVIVSIVIGLLLAGIGYFAYTHMPARDGAIAQVTPEDVTSPRDAQTEPVQEGKKIPFTDFLKKSGSYKCVVNQNVGGAETKGTTYINDGMIRGEYNTKVQTMSMDSTIIVRDGYTYTWTSLSPTTGFKAKVVAPESTDTPASTSGSYSFNASQIGDYSCEPWTLDTSMFELPSGIVFTEIKQ